MGKMKQQTDEQPVKAADQETTPQTVSRQEPVSELLLTHQAFGIFKAPNGEWTVSVIMYNPITGQAGLMKTIPTGGFRDMAIEKFKIEAGHMLYLDQ